MTSPALKLLLAAAVSLLVVAPIHTWMFQSGELSELTHYDTLPGQSLYVVSKLVALYAVEMIWLQAMLGLLRRPVQTHLKLDAGHWRKLHGALGLTTFVLVASHVGLFVIATTLRNNASALDLLLPWGKGVYRTWVALGAAAFWMLCIAIAAQLIGKWRASRLRPWLHRLTLIAAVLILTHALAIGSESRSGAMFYVVLAMASLLILAALYRWAWPTHGSGNSAPLGPAAIQGE